MSDENKPGPHLEVLLQQLAGEGLSPAQWQELNQLLLTSFEARREYLRFQYLNARLATLAWVPAQHPPFPVSPGAGPSSEPADAELQKLIENFHALEATGATPLARSASEGVSPSPTRSVSEVSPSPPSIHIPHSAFRITSILLHPIALVLLVGLIATGILAYKFSTTPTQTIAQRPSANTVELAARLIDATGVQWLESFGSRGETLKSGQRLVLTRGSAEILFGSQAKVILTGPAEFEIVAAGACRLSAGRLTAHVPQPARGFQVHTPGGTVTDLGTEFGVYVSTGPDEQEPAEQESAEQEQPPTGGPPQDGQQAPVTEVHVFKGQVDVTPPPKEATPAPPKSEIRNQKSKIISAGQAVTISGNKVQPLPAADPSKFALDKLHGNAPQVVRAEDVKGIKPTGSATITFVAAGGNPDVTTKGAWRTKSVVKSLDADRDNVYGSDGYFMPTSGSVSPTYLQTLALPPGTLTYAGDPNYAQIDNPASLPNKMPSQLYYRTPASPAVNIVSFSISGSLSGSKSFRLGILVDNQGSANTDSSGISPSTLRVHQTVGGAATSATINGAQAAVPNRAEPHWYFFDIVGAVANQQFVIEVGGNGAFLNQVGIGGLTFDSLPAETVPKN
ncbi:MAG: FecR family protein [Planctomycetes bacterium]|nr:FecR family protein [Planctomycetota bacterium]